MLRNKYAFTLLEVLIALIILAIAFIAVLKTTQSNIRDTLHVKNALAAEWVAMNIYSELQIGIIQLPKTDNTLKGTMSMLQNNWPWKISLDSDTGGSKFQRITIDVYLGKKRYQQLTGFVRA